MVGRWVKEQDDAWFIGLLEVLWPFYAVFQIITVLSGLKNLWIYQNGHFYGFWKVNWVLFLPSDLYRWTLMSVQCAISHWHHTDAGVCPGEWGCSISPLVWKLGDSVSAFLLPVKFSASGLSLLWSVSLPSSCTHFQLEHLFYSFFYQFLLFLRVSVCFFAVTFPATTAH